MGSKTSSWSDQWGNGVFDSEEKDFEKPNNKSNKKKMEQVKAFASTELVKAKSAVVVGAHKVKKEKSTSLHGRSSEDDLLEDMRLMRNTNVLEYLRLKRNKNVSSGHYTSSSSDTNTSIFEVTSHPPKKKTSKDKGKRKIVSSDSIENIQEVRKQQYDLEMRKIEALRAYTAVIEKRERRKQKFHEFKLLIKLLEMRPITMTEKQQKLFDKMIEKRLSED